MKKLFPVLLFVALLAGIAGCGTQTGSANQSEIRGSGTISAGEIGIASEIGGRVVEVRVQEGDSVKQGDVLFKVDDTLIAAERDRTQKAVDLASLSVMAAQTQLESAQLQAEAARLNARMLELPARVKAWNIPIDKNLELPNWYYQKEEQIGAARNAVDAAARRLQAAQDNLTRELAKLDNQEFIRAEQQLAQAAMSLQAAQQTLDQAKNAASDRDRLVNAAQEMVDSDKAALDVARIAYDQLLDTSAADSILEARARVAVTQAQWEYTQDQLAQLQSGEDSLAVRAADLAVRQAETAVTQAEDNLGQARAALKVLDIQLEKTVVHAPADGIILSRNLEAGEIIGQGGVVMTVGRLETVTLTVYIPEDQYANIAIGQDVDVTVDSFSGKTFRGTVSYISNTAEFTPRNVQTVETRKTTVYAVKILLPNPGGELKPGMPADAVFLLP